MTAAATAQRAPWQAPLENAEYMLLWYLGFHRFILSDDRWAPLRPLYRTDPAELANVDRMRQLHYAVMCHIHHSLDPALLNAFRTAVDAYAREVLGVPPVLGMDCAKNDFDRVGYLHRPPVEADVIAEMKDYFADKQVRRGMYTGEGNLCTVAESRDSNIANFPTETVVSCPHLLEIANDPATLGAVARHLGAAPMILGFSCWWSFAGPADPRDAQLFHLDNADYYFCKLTAVRLTERCWL